MAKWTYRAKDFYDGLTRQGYACPLTGRRLEPENTVACHVLPLSKGGKHEAENIYLVVNDLLDIKKNLTDAELAALCYDVLKTIGEKYGYKVSKNEVSARHRP